MALFWTATLPQPRIEVVPGENSPSPGTFSGLACAGRARGGAGQERRGSTPTAAALGAWDEVGAPVVIAVGGGSDSLTERRAASAASAASAFRGPRRAQEWDRGPVTLSRAPRPPPAATASPPLSTRTAARGRRNAGGSSTITQKKALVDLAAVVASILAVPRRRHP